MLCASVSQPIPAGVSLLQEMAQALLASQGAAPAVVGGVRSNCLSKYIHSMNVPLVVELEDHDVLS